MTPEGRVKKDIKAFLVGIDAWFFMPVSNGFGVMGIPDFVGCHKGKFFAIEAKANGGKPTTRQQLVMGAIKRAGGLVLVVDEHSLNSLEQLKD